MTAHGGNGHAMRQAALSEGRAKFKDDAFAKLVEAAE